MAHRSRIAADIVTALADMKQPLDMEDGETAHAVFSLIQDVVKRIEAEGTGRSPGTLILTFTAK